MITTKHDADASYDFAVIGMGIGGLTIGALLAQAGKKVVILERHYLPGGYGQTFREGKYSFCAELHYVWDCGPGQRVSRMLEKLGIEGQVVFRQLNPDGFDRIVAPGIDYTIGNGFERECQRLAALFPGQEKSLREYYSIIDTIHQQAYDLPLGYSWRTVVAHPLRFSHIIRYQRWTLQDLFDKLEFPQDLQLILAGQSGIFCLPPNQLSLLAQASGVGSYNSGAYVPEQSFEHVIKSLLQTIKDQPRCKAMLSTDVSKINVNHERASSVTTTEGQTIEAENIVFDGDPQLSLDLVGREYFPESFQKKLEYEYGSSALSVYLGLDDIDLQSCGLGEETIYWHPSTDLNAIYERQFAEEIPDQPYICLDSPTLRMKDPKLAPAGCHQLVIVTPCSYRFFRNLRDQDESKYQAAKQDYADRIIEIVEREFVPGLSKHIVTRVVGSPLTNEYYVNAPQGNCYGMPLDPQHINLGHLNYQSPIPNLFYVGASSGMPGFAAIIHFVCMLYAKLTGDDVYRS